MIERTTSNPLFKFFLDGSRHVYKVDDIAIGRKIFPVLAGQIVVGCCERIDRDTFKSFDFYRRFVLSLPDDFDYDDGGENYCRYFCEGINDELSKMSYVKVSGIKVDKILLYKTDQKDPYKSDKDSYKSRGTAKIQAEMTDEEQNMVSELCKKNKLDSKHFLIKDGSLQYNPNFSNFDREDKTLMKENYRFVVGVVVGDALFGRVALARVRGSRPFEDAAVRGYDRAHSVCHSADSRRRIYHKSRFHQPYVPYRLLVQHKEQRR